jgi:hypothetical protein
MHLFNEKEKNLLRNIHLKKKSTFYEIKLIDYENILQMRFFSNFIYTSLVFLTK